MNAIIWPTTGKEMVHIPAGPFLYAERREPRELPDFWIDRTPVTCAEYTRFLAAVPAHPVPHTPQAWGQPYCWDLPHSGIRLYGLRLVVDAHTGEHA